MNRLRLLEGRHLGERCIIVANGPSLNSMDLSFLHNEVVIGLNKIFLGFNKFHFYPKYLVAINEKVISQSADTLKSLNCIKFLNGEAGRKYLKENALTYFINTSNPPTRFCKDITSGVHEGWTVTYAALQIAYFLGFKEVVLIGLDHRYKYDGEPNEARKMVGLDQNHFSSDYFSDGQKWDNPDLRKSEESFQIARDIYKENGRRILDATVKGSCKIFEKMDYKLL